ncbi:amidophosphoribosyltransferase [Salinibacillus kushneri]|uniref:Amidophosphoribosyltransferase n=1 Tax=Salinibacillus kushneri TaxID=237682 RepID=A0A1I0IWC7_9BACI|nr:amidophosphoribosyltransferase [Salinibacillus kushneri]SEU01698.1 amidophosphoribosyltransferase [Salinibacillus kushneri]
MLAEMTGLNEECGVFGVFGHPEAIQLTYYSLHSMQHRGQEGAGMVISDQVHMQQVKGEGLVTEVFHEDLLKTLSGSASIGHVRYSTAGGGGYENVQPLFFKTHTHSLALAHNGNLTNAIAMREQLERDGSIFQTSSDTEVLAHLIRKHNSLSFKDQIKQSLPMLEGAFAFLIMTEDQMIAALDPLGMRPLSLGKIDGAWAVASETCAFDVIGAEYVREVEPGEMVIIDDEGIRSEYYTKQTERALCSMEYVYFARPDSNVDGLNIHSTRKMLGKQLAKEAFVEADVVTGVPDSSISAAIGFAEESNTPYELGLIKNRYVGRTFIKPSQELREKGVQMKLSPVRKIVEGKRVVMVDDSIVRGTTSKKIVSMLREAGAKEVHVRISSPPITNPCYYGIDTSSAGELIAAKRNVAEICQLIGADSLSYLSIDGMLEAIGRPSSMKNCGQCLACFTGNYPTEIHDHTVRPHEKISLI